MRRYQKFLLVVCCLALTTLAFAKTDKTKTIVTYPSGFAVSGPVSEMPVMELPLQEVLPVRPSPLSSHPGAPVNQDSAVQKIVLPNVGATKGVDFDGIGANGFAPSDVNLAVGPNHIVQVNNIELGIFSKTGTLLKGPVSFHTFFSALGGNCANGASDPIANYDRKADRWVISDIGYTGNSPFLECVGVSKTNDPTGSYTLYSFSFGTSLNDYPKLSVWATTSNSAYLATYNIFGPGGFAGAQLCGMDRAKMLAGTPGAAQLCKQTPNSEGSYLPGDMDGPTPPADGTPGLFLTWQNNNPGQLFLRKLTLNFTAGTATLSSATTINVANDNLACGNGGACVPQLGTGQTLDSLGDRLMYRFAIRHFADHDRAVVNHAVANGSQVAERWYEIFDPAGTVTLNQQGTFAPDTTYRWMGSMAEDKNGDIGFGYSASSSSINPAIRFTGRVPSDPAGTLETEASQLAGTGSQTGGLSRWGDYSAMQVDPSDDCTFWYTNQYEKVSGSFNWSTNIGSWVFNGCSGGGGGPVLTFSTTHLKFVARTVGTTSLPKAVKVTNTGTATANFTSITISGDFAIHKNTCGASLAPGLTCKVSVTFTPTAKGLRTGSLTFTDNAPGSPQVISLSGTGL